jgi:hypothetical protein
VNLLVKRTPRIIPIEIAAMAKPISSPCRRFFHADDRQFFLEVREYY